MKNKAENQETQEMQEKKEKTGVFKTLKRIGYIIFNLLYTAAFITYSAIKIYNKNQTVPWVPYVIIAMSVIYFICFVVTLLVGSKREVKASVKNYKSSLKIFKKVLKLSNLALSVMMITNTVLYDNGSKFSLILAIVSVPVVILQIAKEIKKMIKRKKKMEIAEQKDDLKKDVKEIVSSSMAEPTEETSTQGKTKAEIMKGKIKDADKKLTAITGSAQKIQQRTKQYNDDKKQIGKKPEDKKKK